MRSSRRSSCESEFQQRQGIAADRLARTGRLLPEKVAKPVFDQSADGYGFVRLRLQPGERRLLASGTAHAAQSGP
jgi:hypothetical protein